MVYAEITVKVFVNEDRLTAEQQVQERKADILPTEPHPLDEGVENLQDVIAAIGLSQFRYLGKGINAVRIEVE